MGTAAFIAFLMSLCDKRFTATQYALLSSLMAVAGCWPGSNRFHVKSLGWPLFYGVSVLGALPESSCCPVSPLGGGTRKGQRGDAVTAGISTALPNKVFITQASFPHVFGGIQEKSLDASSSPKACRDKLRGHAVNIICMESC